MGEAPESPLAPAGGITQEAKETRIEVAVAVAVVVGFQAVLAWLSLRNGWVLFHVHGWIWWVPIPLELLLLGLLVVDRTGSVTPGNRRRKEGIALLAFIAFWNAVTVALLILELFTGEVRTGGELMMEATVVLATLVLTFGLLFWELDGGGPRGRASNPGGERDFLFSEMAVPRPDLVPADWHPRLVDYTYLAFVTAIAWSAADTLPLSRRAKALMAAETAIAALTILLVAARAISIFG